MSRLESLYPRPFLPGPEPSPGPQGESNRERAQACLTPHTHSLRPALQAKAVQLEHEMFRNAKAANLYKASVLKKVGPGRGRQSMLMARVGEAAPPHSQAAHPLAPGSPESTPCPRDHLFRGSLTSLCRVEVFLAHPVRSGTCPGSRCPQLWATEPTGGRPGVGAVRS